MYAAPIVVVALIVVVGIVIRIHIALHLVSGGDWRCQSEGIEVEGDAAPVDSPSQLLGISKVTLIVDVIALAHAIPVGLARLLLLVRIIGEQARGHRGISL